MAGELLRNAAIIANTSIRRRAGRSRFAGHPSVEAAPKTLKSILEQAGLKK
jgi:hypothetical protein